MGDTEPSAARAAPIVSADASGPATPFAWAADLIRRVLGIRRGLRVEGVYFKELSPVPLERSLSEQGAGYKDYRVTFRDRSKQVIRCSRGRVFADLMGPVGIDRLEPLIPWLRPGSRVLEFDSGTGYRAHWLSFVVGPAGGVVAIGCDRDDVRFARRRYARPNVSFELAEGFALAGELDGSFDAVVALDTRGEGHQRRLLVDELFRLVSPGGVLLLDVRTDLDAGTTADALAERLGARVKPATEGPDWSDVLMVRPDDGAANEARRDRRGRRGEGEPGQR